MQYKAKSISALHIALGGLRGKMRVEADPDIGVSATTVSARASSAITLTMF